MTTAHISKIRDVGAADLAEVTGILTDAHLHSRLAAWLIPNVGQRRARLATYFHWVAEHVVRQAVVEGAVVDDSGLDAVALWLRAGDAVYVDEVGYNERRTRVLGPDIAQRFAGLEYAMFWQRPSPDEYLAFLAVRPAQQDTTVAGALLRHHSRRLDTVRLTARTHVSDPDTQALLTAHGYQAEPRQPAADLPNGGPRLLAMVRHPDADPRSHRS